MALIDPLRACNAHDLSGFRRLVIAGRPVGWVRKPLAERLAHYPTVFNDPPGQLVLADRLGTPTARTAALTQVCQRLAADGALPPERGEIYPVLDRWGASPLALIDRAFAPALGVRAFGVHVNGYVPGPDGPSMWIGRRAEDRQVAPGKLDNMVAGGQPHGLTVWENLLKEAEEEASVPRALAEAARPVGLVSYRMEVPEGLKDDVLFCFDLELPATFRPENADGEITGFELWPMATVVERLADADDFKFNVPLVILDFLVRHGVLTPDTPDYVDIVNGLRAPEQPL